MEKNSIYIIFYTFDVPKKKISILFKTYNKCNSHIDIYPECVDLNGHTKEELFKNTLNIDITQFKNAIDIINEKIILLLIDYPLYMSLNDNFIILSLNDFIDLTIENGNEICLKNIYYKLKCSDSYIYECSSEIIGLIIDKYKLYNSFFDKDKYIDILKLMN